MIVRTVLRLPAQNVGVDCNLGPLEVQCLAYLNGATKAFEGAAERGLASENSRAHFGISGRLAFRTKTRNHFGGLLAGLNFRTSAHRKS